MSLPGPNPTATTISLAEGATLVQVVDKYLSAPNVDVAKLEQMVKLQERMARWNAETSFNGSMADAQAEIKRIAPDKANSQTRSRYASYAAMDEEIRHIYSAHGFSLQFNSEDSPQPGCIRIVCDVAKGGHVKQFRLDMPADGKGARGNDVMTRTHATGSAVTYGRRYLLAMIFNVAVGEDDDGNAAGRKTARARIEDIKNLPEDERGAASEQMHEDYSQREADRMRNGMSGNDLEIWDDANVSTKNQFLLATREHIRTATDPSALVAWWNSDEQKRMRQDFELTRNENVSLRDFVLARRDALKAG